MKDNPSKKALFSKARLQKAWTGGAPRWFPAALAVLVPLALYSWFLAGAPSRWPLWWFCALGAALLPYAALSVPRGRRVYAVPALFLAGLLIAGAAGLTGLGWLHTAFIPYVLSAGALLGPLYLFIAALFVPVLEAPHLAGGPGGEELAVLVITAFSAALFIVVSRRKGQAGKAEVPVRVREPDISGLSAGEDPEITEILKAAAYTLKPDTVSLFLMMEGELALRCSTDGSLRLTAPGVVHDVVRFRHAIVENELGGFRSGAGYRGRGRAASAAASPVLDGSIILGVLAVDSSRAGAFGDGTIALLELFAAQVSRVLRRQRIHAETEKNIQWLSVIHEESSRLLTTLEVDDVVQLAAESMQRITSASVYFFLKSGESHVLKHKNGLVPNREIRFSLNGTLTEMALKEKERKYFSNLKGYPLPVLPFDDGPVASALMLPLVYGGEALGAVVFASGEQDALAPREVDCLSVLGNQAAVSLKNAVFHEEIKRKSVTDGLTGLYNHRHFKELLGGELRRFSRAGKPFSLLFIDIDLFKKINDTFGHPAGDAVLRGAAGLIREALREIDVPARYGGEEFAVLLLDTDAEGAFRMAERLRTKIMDAEFPDRGMKITITVSIGLASCPTDGETAEKLIDRADRALYRAKAGGRNQTVAYGAARDTL